MAHASQTHSVSRRSKKPPVVLVSGGHLTPALATIEYFQKHHPEVKILFIGREYSQEKERQVAKEREMCERLGIPFFPIHAAKFHRTNWWRNFGELAHFFPSLYRSWLIIRENDVDLFLSFGGYLAIPVAFAAKLLGRKVVTHEQTKTSGLANEVIASIADRVAISFEVSRKHFPRHKTLLTGNPIRASLLEKALVRPEWLPANKKPLLYITGGSQGSQVINQSVQKILPKLTEKFLVVHQCGQSEHQHYLRDLHQSAEELPEELQDSYVVREWVDEQEVGWLFQNAALAIARSGANTSVEIALHSVPTIFIPLPFSHNNEQLKNAQAIVDVGAAILLEQKDLDAKTLWDAVKDVSAQRAYMRKRAEKRRSELKTDGAATLAELCLSLLRSEGWITPVQHWLAAGKRALQRVRSNRSSSAS